MVSVNEEWRAVKGYEGLYEVSSIGRVRSLDREAHCMTRWGSSCLKKTKGRILREWKSGSGYANVGLNVDGGMARMQIHRLVADAFVGDANGRHVNHRDGNKLNNCESNLEYVTPRENTAHAMQTGLMRREGEDNPSVRYSADQIRHAHSLVVGGATYAEVSEQTGLKVGAIVSACIGKTWKSLGLKVVKRQVGHNQWTKPAGE